MKISNVALIEFQTTGGSWLKVCDCQNNSATIKHIMEAIFRSNPKYMKLRAIDSVSKILIDISYR